MSDRGDRNNTPEGPRDEDSEHLIAAALEEYLERLARGQLVSVEEFQKEHPHLAPQLEETLRAVGEVQSIVGRDNSSQTFGDYSIIREIGRGGMGVVHEAWEASLDRRVAVKMLPAGLLAEPRAVARFEREARISARLHHPNIVEIFRMGIEAGVPYFVMEFVEGRTLRELQTTRRLPCGDAKGVSLEEEGPLPVMDTLSRLLTLTPSTRSSLLNTPTRESPRRSAQESIEALSDPQTDEHSESDTTLQVGSETATELADEESGSNYLDFRKVAEAFAGVAEGLHHAHSLGIIHRDLKPSNLMLDCIGNLRILDFGLAWIEGQERLTISQESVGTPLYMSPEQAEPGNHPLGRGTDIYSLGATIYEIISGRPPFYGKTIPQTLNQIITTDPPPLGKQNRATPKDLETIVHKCLRKPPRERYGTAEALAQDLRRFSRGEPVEARSYTKWEKLIQRAWRSRGKLVAAACLVVLLSVLTVLGVKYREQSRLVRLGEYTELVNGAVTKMQRGFLQKGPKASPGVYSGGVYMPQGMIFTDPADFHAAIFQTASHHVQDALAELDVAVEKAPTRPDAHYHRARCFLVLDLEDEALKELKVALTCDPGFVPARILRATIFERSGDLETSATELGRAGRDATSDWAETWLHAHRANLTGDWREAEVAFGRLMEMQETGGSPYVGASMEILLSRGSARLEQGEFEGAIRDFARAQGRWPHQLEPALLLGRAYLLDGRDPQASKVFEELLRRTGLEDKLALAFAETYCSVGRNEEGLGWLRQVEDEHLRERSLAPVHIWLGELEEAKKAARRAIELSPDDPLSNLWLGLALYVEQGESEEVIQQLRKAVLLKPDNGMAHVWLGDALASQGKLDEALLHYQEATRRDPGNPWSYISQGVTRERQGKLDEAFGLYVTAFEVDPGLSAVYHHVDGLFRRAGSLHLGEELDRFVELVEEVIEAGGDHPLLPDLLRVLSLSLSGRREVGDVEKALHYARLAVERIGGSRPRMLAALAEAQSASGSDAEAVVTLERGVSLSHANRFQLSRLESCRDAIFPDLVSPASVDAALAERQVQVVIPEGAEWKFFRGRTEPSAGTLAWTIADYDDSAWETGPSGFGFADDDDQTHLDDMKGAYTTVYVRRELKVPDLTQNEDIVLSVAADDGFVAYLNGTEILRTRLRPSSGPVPHNAIADFTLLVEPPLPSECRLDPALLLEGRNVLALQGLNAGLTSSDFSLIPVVRMKRSPDPGRDAELLEKLREAAGAERPISVAYLEARTLQRGGDFDGAAKKFLEVAILDHRLPEPVIRLAECHQAAGRPADATAILHEALRGPLSAEPRAWRAWITLCFVDLELPPLAILSELPLQPGTVGSEPQAAIRLARDYRWLLECLHMAEPILINCGGEGFRDSEGRLWGHDRFHLAGCRYGETAWSPLPEDEFPFSRTEIEDTDDDLLYQSERWFPADTIAPAGYSIPVPPASYRVTLHFAEIFATRPGTRIFHVSIEGNRTLDWYEPLKAGFATADSQKITVDVKDGFLDIEFLPEAEFPKVSAIEVERVR